MMHRTNIYLDDEQLRLLKHVAAADGSSMADVVRHAVDLYLARRFADEEQWHERFARLISRVQQRIPPEISPDEIEADITAARGEVRQAHRATRRR